MGSVKKRKKKKKEEEEEDLTVGLRRPAMRYVPATKNHLRKRNNDVKSETVNSYIKRINRNWRFSGKRLLV